MHRTPLPPPAPLVFLLTTLLIVGCGNGSDEPPGDGGQGASPGGGTASGGSSNGGSSNAGSDTAGETSAGGIEAGGTEAGGGGPSFSHQGVCGLRGEGTVTADAFEGFVQYYIVGEEQVDEGILDEYICAIRFDVVRAGDAPGNCGDFAGQQDACLWAHRVTFENPEVVTDEGGVCAASELGLDEAAIAELDGSEAAYGFVSEYAGHNSVLLLYDEDSDTWEPNGNATWDPDTGEFRFDRRDGFCGY